MVVRYVCTQYVCLTLTVNKSNKNILLEVIFKKAKKHELKLLEKMAFFVMTKFLQIEAQTLSSVTGMALAPCYVGDVHSNI